MNRKLWLFPAVLEQMQVAFPEDGCEFTAMLDWFLDPESDPVVILAFSRR